MSDLEFIYNIIRILIQFPRQNPNIKWTLLDMHFISRTPTQPGRFKNGKKNLIYLATQSFYIF